MKQLPETGFLRLKQILELVPVSKSTWWLGVKTGRFPRQIKIGPNTSCWRVEDIRALIEGWGGNHEKETFAGIRFRVACVGETLCRNG
jgi:predicted DNA-binding transcriptional regulator AlpA